MKFNIFKILKYQLYLLQLENYQILRYWQLLFKRGWYPTASQRKDLVWTRKVLSIAVIAELLLITGVGFLINEFNLTVFENSVAVAIIFVGIFLLSNILFFPVFLVIANIILSPVDWLVKTLLIFKAKSKIKQLESQIKIIGVAGSYGKTTMKEILKTVLSAQFAVFSTLESVNTPVGIARWVLNKVDASMEVLIVEMGEHYKGDIAEICKIIKPDVSVVTGINEAHLERMGSLENITATIFEIIAGSKPKSLVVLNAEDSNVMSGYRNFISPDHRVLEYKIEDVESRMFDAEALVWEGQLKNLGKFELGLLGKYSLGNLSAVVKIAYELGMTTGKITKGIANIKPVEHRLQPIKSRGEILVIDDSYNGNPAGVKEAIQVLSRFNSRRKLYITPGLVETGKSTKEIHIEIGRQLEQVADVVILIKNSVSLYIAEGIKTKSKIIWFNTAQEAHAGLGKILKPNDVIVFQNDWGDAYV